MDHGAMSMVIHQDTEVTGHQRGVLGVVNHEPRALAGDKIEVCFRQVPRCQVNSFMSGGRIGKGDCFIGRQPGRDAHAEVQRSRRQEVEMRAMRRPFSVFP